MEDTEISKSVNIKLTDHLKTTKRATLLLFLL